MYIEQPDTVTPEILTKFVDATPNEREVMKNKGLLDQVPHQQIQDLFEFNELQRCLAAVDVKYLREQWIGCNLRDAIDQLKAMAFIDKHGDNYRCINPVMYGMLIQKQQKQLAKAINNNLECRMTMETLGYYKQIGLEFIKLRDEFKLEIPIQEQIAGSSDFTPE